MTDLRRRWIAPLDHNEILSALDQAARELMRGVCNDEPEDCMCPANQMTPLDAIDWIRGEVLRRRRGDDDERAALTREHKSAGQRLRWDGRLEAVAS